MNTLKLAFILLGLTIAASAQQAVPGPVKNCLAQIEKLSYDWKLYDALERCNECLKKNPESALLYAARADVHMYLNHMEASAIDFQKAVTLNKGEIDPEELKFYRFMSDTAFLVKELVDSITFLTLQPENGYAKTYTLADTLRGMLRPERTCFDITYQNLSVRVKPDTRSIEGSNEIYFNVVEPSTRIQLDLFDHYQILDISMNGGSLSYTRSYNAIFIEFEKKLQKDSAYVVKVSYSGAPRLSPNPPWDGGFIWSKRGERHDVGVSCEQLGASSWWPTKDHLSEKPDSMDIHIQAPDGYDVISNGNLISTRELTDGYTSFHWHVSYPINSYNVTFYMGDYVNFSESYVNSSGQSVPIDYYVNQAHLDSAKRYYAKTIRIVETFEKLFGDYPFPDDGLGFVEAPFSGMEHQGAIAIGDVYKEDSSYQVYQGYPFLLVHEMAHEWWGNSVSAGDMADLWLQEGFATYSEHLLVEALFGTAKYIEDVSENGLYVMNIWPMVAPVDVNDNAFLGGDVYNKGAAMLHNLRCIMNDDALFLTMIKNFYLESKMKIISSQDFIDHVSKYYPRDLTDFYEVFMYRTKPPVLEYSYAPTRRGESRLRYRWTNVGEGFEMPFLLLLNGYIGQRIEGTTRWQELDFDRKLKDFHLASSFSMAPWINHENAFTYYIARMVEE